MVTRRDFLKVAGVTAISPIVSGLWPCEANAMPAALAVAAGAFTSENILYTGLAISGLKLVGNFVDGTAKQNFVKNAFEAYETSHQDNHVLLADWVLSAIDAGSIALSSITDAISDAFSDFASWIKDNFISDGVTKLKFGNTSVSFTSESLVDMPVYSSLSSLISSDYVPITNIVKNASNPTINKCFWQGVVSSDSLSFSVGDLDFSGRFPIVALPSGVLQGIIWKYNPNGRSDTNWGDCYSVLNSSTNVDSLGSPIDFSNIRSFMSISARSPYVLIGQEDTYGTEYQDSPLATYAYGGSSSDDGHGEMYSTSTMFAPTELGIQHASISSSNASKYGLRFSDRCFVLCYFKSNYEWRFAGIYDPSVEDFVLKSQYFILSDNPYSSSSASGFVSFDDAVSTDLGHVIGHDVVIGEDGEISDRGTIGVIDPSVELGKYADVLIGAGVGVVDSSIEKTSINSSTEATAGDTTTQDVVKSAIGSLHGEVSATGQSSTTNSLSAQFAWEDTFADGLFDVFPFNLPKRLLQFSQLLSYEKEPPDTIDIPFFYSNGSINIDDPFSISLTYLKQLRNPLRAVSHILQASGLAYLAKRWFIGGGGD